MATAKGYGSGTTGASSYCLRLECWESFTNNSENYSDVTIQAWLDSTNYNFYGWGIPVNLSIDGVNVYSGTPNVNIDKNSSFLIAQATRRVPHNNDGSKKISFSGSISRTDAYYLPGNANCSGEFDLTGIPRASQPSINTYPNNSPDFNIGDTITIHMNRKSSSFTHIVNFKYSNNIRKIAANVTDNCTFDTSTIEDELYDLIPDSNVLKGTIEVITYNGSSKIGSSTCSFNAKVSSNIVPVISDVTFSQNLIEESIDAYVQSKSRITYSVTANGVKGSKIKTYKVEINGETHNQKEDTTEVLTSVGTNNCKITVTDTRGMSATLTKTFEVLAYTKPKIDYFVSERNEDIETQIDFSYTVSVSSLKGANRFELEVFVVDSGSYIPNITCFEDLQKIVNKLGAHQRSGRVDLHNSSFFIQMDAENAFDMYCVVIDTFNEVTIQKIEIGTAEELVNFSADGKNVAIGQIYNVNQGGRLQVKGSIVLNGTDLIEQVLLAAHPVGSLYWSIDPTPPDELFGGTWQQIEDVFVLAAGTNYNAGITGGSPSKTIDYRNLPNAVYVDLSKSSGAEYITPSNSGTRWISSLRDAGLGSGTALDIMPPYITRYCWERTA